MFLEIQESLMKQSASSPFIHNLIFAVLMTGCAFATCAAAQQTAESDAKKPQLPRVTTTVEVKGEVKNDYLQTSTTATSLYGETLKETPLSVSAVSRGVLNDQVARTLTDVVKNDASIAEDYAPVGYYGTFEIRGFPLDLATALQINGITIAGEQDVPLENKQSVEVVKGIAGAVSGVASSGGLINFVTKRPVKDQRVAVEMATDHRGTSYGALDAGRVFGVRYEPGVRINLAGEDMHTYVQHADGWRGVGAADVSLKLDAQTNAYIDFDYQHKVQRSEAGYQLLGGSTVPSPVHASTMLGYQSWSKPNTFDTFNASARLLHSFFFCPDGSYEVYDYRSPDELRTNAVGAALVEGRVKTGPLTHEIVGGGELFARRVELSSSTVYLPLGVENVYQPNISFAQDSEQAGPSALADYSHEGSGIVQDRVRIPGGFTLLAGGRYTRLSAMAYDGKARTLWLPQYAAMWAPTSTLTVYGNYGVLLSLGPQAPWWVDNASAFLEPFHTRQSEVGVKFEKQILLTASVFRMRQPFFYPRIIATADEFCTTNAMAGTDVAAGDQCFEADGRETHTGFEMNAQGKVTRWMQLTASAVALRAHSDDSSTASYNGVQVINVPRARATLFADVAVPHARGLHLLPGWNLTSRKEATRDDAVSVGGYSLFNVGARWSPRGDEGHLTLRLYADNVLNKRYWKDTGANYGDTFIHQGAPATVRLAAHYTF
jgi:iron complex outermembrane receptor protein